MGSVPLSTCVPHDDNICGSLAGSTHCFTCVFTLGPQHPQPGGTSLSIPSLQVEKLRRAMSLNQGCKAKRRPGRMVFLSEHQIHLPGRCPIQEDLPAPSSTGKCSQSPPTNNRTTRNFLSVATYAECPENECGKRTKAAVDNQMSILLCNILGLSHTRGSSP